MNLLTIAYLPHAKQHAAWRKEMKAMRKQLQTTTEAITGSFAEANSNQVLGIGNIVIIVIIRFPRFVDVQDPVIVVVLILCIILTVIIMVKRF